MNDLIDGTQSRPMAIGFDRSPIGNPLPRRVMRARREAAAALALAASDSTPSWTVAPAPEFGAAVPLDDDQIF